MPTLKDVMETEMGIKPKPAKKPQDQGDYFPGGEGGGVYVPPSKPAAPKPRAAHGSAKAQAVKKTQPFTASKPPKPAAAKPAPLPRTKSGDQDTHSQRVKDYYTKQRKEAEKNQGGENYQKLVSKGIESAGPPSFVERYPQGKYTKGVVDTTEDVAETEANILGAAGAGKLASMGKGLLGKAVRGIASKFGGKAAQAAEGAGAKALAGRIPGRAKALTGGKTKYAEGTQSASGRSGPQKALPAAKPMKNVTPRKSAPKPAPKSATKPAPRAAIDQANRSAGVKTMTPAERAKARIKANVDKRKKDSGK